MRLRRICNCCSTVYSSRRRKCPTSYCRAPIRFSTEETVEGHRAWRERMEAREALLQSLAAEASAEA